MRSSLFSLLVLGLLSSCAGSFYQSNQMYIPDQDSAKVKISGVIGYSGYQVLAAIPVYKGISAYGNFLNYNSEIDPSSKNADAYRPRQSHHEEINLGVGYNPKSNFQKAKNFKYSFSIGYGQGFGATKKGIATGTSSHFKFTSEKAPYQKLSLQSNIGFKRRYSRYHTVFTVRASYLHLDKYTSENYFDTYYTDYNDFEEYSSLSKNNVNTFLLEPALIIQRETGKYVILFFQTMLRYFTNSTLNFQRRNQAWEAPVEFFVGVKFNPALFSSVLNK